MESDGKFWECNVSGSNHTVRWGKIGSSGTTKTKEFDSHDLALKDAKKTITEKSKKGYKEVRTPPVSTKSAVKDKVPVKSSTKVTTASTSAKLASVQRDVAEILGEIYDSTNVEDVEDVNADEVEVEEDAEEGDEPEFSDEEDDEEDDDEDGEEKSVDEEDGEQSDEEFGDETLLEEEDDGEQ